MKIDFEVIFLTSIPVVLILVFLANRKFRIFDAWINLIKKTGPLFLTFFPISFTYFFVCGSLSAIMVLIYVGIRGKDHLDRNEFIVLEDGVEFLCSFLMCVVYFYIITKRKFPFFWTILITLTHMLAAGYRDAKFIYTPATAAAKSHFESGPIILSEIQWLDAAIPLIAFLVFFFFLKKRWESSKIPELPVLET
jgi:hypothetical protein